MGLPGSEAWYGYRLHRRAPGARIDPVLVWGRLGESRVSDVGRVVLGGESFRLPVPPSGRGVLVLRTAWTADAFLRNGSQVRSQRFHMASPLPLHVRVNGESVATPRLPLRTEADLIQEFPIAIPAAAAPDGGDWLEVAIDGDYLSLGYRFYDGAAAPASR